MSSQQKTLLQSNLNVLATAFPNGTEHEHALSLRCSHTPKEGGSLEEAKSLPLSISLLNNL
jgi:hypothetical protein